MNRFIFIPGKNPELSLAELVSWFDSNGIYFRIQETGEGFITAEAEKAPEADDLGGMIKVCRLLESFDKKPTLHPGSIFDNVPMKDLPKEKLFGLSVYPDSRKNNRFFQHYATSIKKNLREQGINSKFMPVPKDRSALTHVEVLKKGLEETVVCIGKQKIHIGKTASVHNPFEFQKRDTGRPKQRPMFSIPPRLARIMVNLSQTRMEGKRVLLDPFCGMGTILQEASMMGFDILGTDIDEDCVLAAIENLYWASQDYKFSLPDLDKKIMKLDATKLSRVFQSKSIDAIVTEPNLGPALKVRPDRRKAGGILRGLKPLYEKSLKEFSAILKSRGRVCIVFPRFEFGEHFNHPEAQKLAARAGLKPVDILAKYHIPHSFPYVDKEERHKTIREIWVFEKIPQPVSRPEDLPELRYTKRNFKPE
jgi:tRNA G10  N-methylase Trm11